MPSNLDARLNPHAPAVLSLFRVVFGLLFLCHAAAKLFGWFGGPQVPVGSWPFWWAGIIELVTGLLITLGLFTRIAAFVAPAKWRSPSSPSTCHTGSGRSRTAASWR